MGSQRVGQDFTTELQPPISVVLKLRKKTFLLHAALYDSAITDSLRCLYLLGLNDHSAVHFHTQRILNDTQTVDSANHGASLERTTVVPS